MDAVVKNAADKEQVRHARQRELSQRERELHDLSIVLSTKEGRRMMWRLLEHCKVFGSVWHNSALIHYNAGMQDVGHFLLAEINQASADLFLLMMKENKGD